MSGITSLFSDYEQKTFEELHRAIMGIKNIIEKHSPIIILTAPLHEFSVFRPKGGKILSHFAHALVMIKEEKRCIEYSLVQLSKQIEEQKQIIEDLSKKNLMLELTKTKLKTKCQVKRKIIAELRTSCFENDSELNAQKQTIGKLTESNKRFKKKNKILRDDLNLYRTSHSKVSKKLFLISELEGYLSSHEHVDIKVIKEFLTDLEGI